MPGWAASALRSRFSRATTLTSSISAPARSMVAGTHAQARRASGDGRDHVGERRRRRRARRRSTGTPRWCSTPSAVDALPCGSRSTTSTRCPSWASAAATFTVVVVLPTPPFWLATTMTRVRVGTRHRRPRSRAPSRASTVCSAARASGVRVVVGPASASSAEVRRASGRRRAAQAAMFHVKPRLRRLGVLRADASAVPVDNSVPSCG